MALIYDSVIYKADNVKDCKFMMLTYLTIKQS